MLNLRVFTSLLILLSFYCSLSAHAISKIKISSFDKGIIEKQQGNFENALLFFKESYAQAKKENDKKVEYDSLINQGIINWNLGRLEISKEKFVGALNYSIHDNQNEKYEICRTFIDINDLYIEGKEYRKSRNYQKSINCYEEAIDLSKRIKSKEHKLKCLRQLSFVYLELNELKKFFSLNSQAIKLAEEINHKREIGKCLINIGLFYEKIDNYYESLNFCERALAISLELNNKTEISACYNNLGNIYRSMGEYNKSLDYSFKALDLDKILKDEVYICIDLNNIGITYKLKGMRNSKKDFFEESLMFYKEALNLARKIKMREFEIRILNNIGSLYNNLDNPSEALIHFQNSYYIAKEINDVEAMGMILNNLGIIYYNQGDYEESNKYYQQAIDLALEYQGGQVLWEAYLERAKTLEKQNNLTEAIDSYKSSISIIEDIRSLIKLEEHKASFLGTDKRIQAYQNLIQLLAELHNSQPDKDYGPLAFSYLERGKARAFLDSLEISQVDISHGIDAKLQNDEKDLMREISNIYNNLLSTDLSSDDKSKIQSQLKEKEHKLEVLKRKIRTESPVYANLKYPEIVTLREAQKLLDKKSAFFTFSIGEERSYAFIITKKSLKTFPIPPKEELKGLISNYLKIISDKETSDFSAGYVLYSSLISPGLTNNIKKIIFIPDDILHFLPFETLNSSKEGTNWMLHEFQIAYSPSITSLREIIKHKLANGFQKQKDIFAIGDPYFGSLEEGGKEAVNLRDFFSSNNFSFDRLLYSATEIERVCSLFKQKRTNRLLRASASEDKIKEENLEDYRIVHFATHSLIDNQKPLRSSILLSVDDDPTEDGFLQMREIYNLSLNADLVTLSSCQTALGQLIKGEGIEGINRAFFYAGASSVLMSLWPVNDQATSQLMGRFYAHLRSRETLAGSLRKAKLELASSDVLSHPYYWAGFVISGYTDHVIFTSSTKMPLFLLSFLAIGGVVFISVRRRRNHRVSQD